MRFMTSEALNLSEKGGYWEKKKKDTYIGFVDTVCEVSIYF